MEKFFIYIFLIVSTTAQATEYGGELELLRKYDDTIQQQIDDISQQAQIRQNKLETLSEHTNVSRTKEVDLIKVLPEDYAKLKLKPYYQDSIIFYSQEDDSYFEANKVNGITAVISHDDHSATFGYAENGELSKSWKVTCSKDKITDEKTCRLGFFNFAMIYSKGKFTASTSYEVKKLDFRQKQYIRIDNNKAFSTSTLFTGSQLNSLIQQMKHGELAYTRFYEWDGEMYEETLSLYGFSEAYNYMLYAYKNLK